MRKGRQIVANMISQAISFALSVIVSFFLAPFIVGRIGKEVYGFVGLSNNVISYVTVFTVAINSMANRYITVAYVKGDIESANRYFTSVTVANIIIALLLFIPAAAVVTFLDKIVHVPAAFALDIKLLWAFVFAIFILDLIFGRMEVATFASNRLDLNGLRVMESNILKVIILFGMYFLFPPHVAYVGISAFICAVYVVFANKHYMKKLTPELHFQKRLFAVSAVKEILCVGVWNSANQMSQMFFTGLDLLIANLLIGAAGMSLLSIAKMLPMQILAFIGIIAGVFYPQMTICYAKEDKKAFVHETKFATRICGFICSVPIMGVLIFGRIFFSLWLPTLTNDEITQVQILSVLTLLPQVFSIYIFPLYQVNAITCKLKMPSIVDIILGIINVIAVFLLLRYTELGLYAIAGISSFLLILRIVIFAPMYAAHNIRVNLTTFYPPLLRGLLHNLIIGIIFFVISRFFPVGTWMSFALTAGICAIIGYFAGFLILFDRQEQKNIIQKMNGFKMKKGKS